MYDQKIKDLQEQLKKIIEIEEQAKSDKLQLIGGIKTLTMLKGELEDASTDTGGEEVSKSQASPQPLVTL